MADNQKSANQSANAAPPGTAQSSGQPAPQQGVGTTQLPAPIPPKEKEPPEWIIAVPWVIPFVTLYAGFKLGQIGTRTNNVANLIKEDITTFLTKIEAYSTLVKTHQRGNFVEQSENLRKSREHLTQQRREASSLLTRIQGHLSKDADRGEWEMAYLKWKSKTEGESGLITRKTDAWTPSQISNLDDACDEYLATISTFRCRVVSHSIKIKKK